MGQDSAYSSGIETPSMACCQSHDWSSLLPRANSEHMDQQSSSSLNLGVGRCTVEDVMREFRMNGSDSPYNPDEDKVWGRLPGSLSGLGPSSAYLRQKSWPAPERSPAPRLPRPRPRSLHAPLAPHWGHCPDAPPAPAAHWGHSPDAPPAPAAHWGHSPDAPPALAAHWGHSPDAPPAPAAHWGHSPAALPAPDSNWGHSPATPPALPHFDTSTPLFEDGPLAAFSPDLPQEPQDAITQEQTRVLNSIPDRVLYSLLRDLHSERRKKLPQECRFCKNNGERESYFRSHVLKDAAGRVECPVLRAYVCKRCGASGDLAHTIKYCPLSTNEERIKSAAMLRSVRMASGRRRHSLSPSILSTNDYVVFGEPTPSVVKDKNLINDNYGDTALDPLWAALEQKLKFSA